jgi:hypothetical protein
MPAPYGATIKPGPAGRKQHTVGAGEHRAPHQRRHPQTQSTPKTMPIDDSLNGDDQPRPGLTGAKHD